MDEYQTAIQNPKYFFENTELRASTAQIDQHGLPQAWSGGFVLTFRLNGPGQSWAIRCFKKIAENQQQRYAAISEFLNHHPQSIFTTVEYLGKGILVNGTWYPIIKMPWLNGISLNKFVEQNIDSNLLAIVSLAEKFRNLVSTMEKLGVAHGDLQHGNILVENGQLVLVDYDGLYVPALAGLASDERGHVNYQHPLRNAEFGPEIDRFSAIAIYLALKAMTPALWHKYSAGGENILFDQDDFRAPRTAPLFDELELLPDLKPFIQRFRKICESSLAKVPRLADFLTGDVPVTVSEPIKLTTRRSQYTVLEATNRDELLTHVGEVVTVVGRIIDHSLKTTRNHDPYVFLDFGNWRHGSFRLVLWSDTLALFETSQRNTASYNYRWVSVSGLLVKYSNGERTHPQIVIDTLSQIEILGGETEANERLAANVITQSESTPSSDNLIEAEKQLALQRTAQPEDNQVQTGQRPVPVATNLELQVSRLYDPRSSPSAPAAARPPPTQLATTQPPKSPVCIVAPTGPANFRTISEAIKKSTAGTIIRVRPGLYHETLLLNKKIEIIGDGNRDDIIVESSEDATVRMATLYAAVSGLTLRLNVGNSGSNFFGIDIGIGQLILENCDITSDSNACVGIGNKGTAPTIRNCKIHDGKTSGILIYETGGGVIDNCDIFANTNVGIDIRSGANPTVQRCQIHDGKSAGIFAHDNGLGQITDCDIIANIGYGIAISTNGNPSISRCRVGEGKLAGISIYDNGMGQIEDCHIIANAGHGIVIKTGGSSTIRRCKIHDGKAGGIFVFDNGSGQIEDCDVASNTLAGIAIKSHGNPTFQHCKIHNGSAGGVLVFDNGGGRIEDCDIVSNSGYGIEIKTGGNPIVRDCRINNNTYQAIRASNKALGTVEHCNMTGNKIGPIHIDATSTVTQRNNVT
jgi:parallel beta-helix repeat protein